MKQFRPYSFLWMVLTTLILLSCSDKEQEELGELQISKEQIQIAKEGGEEWLYVQYGASVTVTSDQSWCSVTQENSTSQTTRRYKVAVSSNPTTDVRSATVSATGGGVSKQLIVTQAGATSFIIEQKAFEVSCDGETIEVKITTSGNYTIDITQKEWISQATSRAVTQATERFVIAPNPMNESRSGTITFTMADITEQVTLTQAGMEVPEPDKTGMDNDATALVKNIFMGWNLGNTMEVPGGETLWGNPLTTQAMMDAVKASGINAVRIPCAWDSYLEDQINYKIKDSWLARVKEVVDYCVSNEMYAILNIHWDGGWLEENPFYAVQEENNRKQRILWTQIASYFRDYNEYLIFAGTNEVRADYGTPSAENIEVQLSYNQTFVDAVRATGGKNYWRNLVVQTYNTEINHGVNHFRMPTDATPNRLMVEVHYYEPSTYCILDEDADWGKALYFWGKDYEQYATGEYEGRWSGDMGEEYMIGQFQKMKSTFVDNHIPVILGEFAPMHRTLQGSVAQEAHNASRCYYTQFLIEQAKNHGLAPFFWDIGINNQGIFARGNTMQPNQQLLDAVWVGANAGVYPY
ncbi:MAG: cellulase family glycosylhydrolase [Phocaeicola sp.]